MSSSNSNSTTNTGTGTGTDPVTSTTTLVLRAAAAAVGLSIGAYAAHRYFVASSKPNDEQKVASGDRISSDDHPTARRMAPHSAHHTPAAVATPAASLSPAMVNASPAALSAAAAPHACYVSMLARSRVLVLSDAAECNAVIRQLRDSDPYCRVVGFDTEWKDRPLTATEQAERDARHARRAALKAERENAALAKEQLIKEKEQRKERFEARRKQQHQSVAAATPTAATSGDDATIATTPVSDVTPTSKPTPRENKKPGRLAPKPNRVSTVVATGGSTLSVPTPTSTTAAAATPTSTSPSGSPLASPSPPIGASPSPTLSPADSPNTSKPASPDLSPALSPQIGASPNGTASNNSTSKNGTGSSVVVSVVAPPPIQLGDGPPSDSKTDSKTDSTKAAASAVETPIARKHKSQVAVMQLAFRSVTLVIQIHLMSGGVPIELKQLLEDPAIWKTGVEVNKDGRKCFDDYGIDVKGCIDLNHVLKRSTLPPPVVAKGGGQWLGLHAICTHVLGVGLNKDYKVRCGAWDAPVLDTIQVLYGAADAWFAREIFVELFRNHRDRARHETLEAWAAEWVDVRQAKDTPEAIAKEAERTAAKQKKAAERVAALATAAAAAMSTSTNNSSYVEFDFAARGWVRYSDRALIPGGRASADTYHHIKNEHSMAPDATNYMPASAFRVPPLHPWKSTKSNRHWLQYDFPLPVQLAAYSLRSRADGSCRAEMPRSWTLLGKRHPDDKDWVTIHVVDGEAEWLYHPVTHRGKGIQRVYQLPVMAQTAVAAVPVAVVGTPTEYPDISGYRVYRFAFTKGGVSSRTDGEYALSICDIGLWGQALSDAQAAVIERARLLCGLVPSARRALSPAEVPPAVLVVTDVKGTVTAPVVAAAAAGSDPDLDLDGSGSGKPYGGERMGDNDITAMSWSHIASDSFYETRARYNDEYAMDEYKAFSGGWLYKETWHSRSGPMHWISYEATGPIVLTGYSMQARPDRHARVQSPHKWTISGRSASDPEWSVVERVESQPEWDYTSPERDAVPGELRHFSLAARPLDRAYSTYRWHFTRNVQDDRDYFITLSSIRLIGHTEHQERTVIAALNQVMAPNSNADTKKVPIDVIRTIMLYLLQTAVLLK